MLPVTSGVIIVQLDADKERCCYNALYGMYFFEWQYGWRAVFRVRKANNNIYTEYILRIPYVSYRAVLKGILLNARTQKGLLPF